MKEVAILVGTIIGSGILSLPYVFSKAGFLVSIVEMFLIYLLFIFISLLYSKICIKSGKHQFPGYVEILFGRKLKILTLFVLLISLYGTILSYIIAQTNSLLKLLGLNKYVSLLLIFLILNLALIKNIKSVSDFEKANVIIVITFLISSILYFLSFYNINFEKIFEINIENWIYPIGPIIFALFGLNAIPEIGELIKDPKKFGKVIIIGYSIPFVLYSLFTFSILSTQDKIPQIATFLLGKIGYLLTILITLNPMITLSYAIKEIYLFDLNFKEEEAHLLTVLPPFLFSLFLNKVDLFVPILSLVGWTSLLLSLPLIVVMYKKVCK